jgi:hypothetical protein
MFSPVIKKKYWNSIYEVPITTKVVSSWRGVLDTTLCDKVRPDTLVSSTNKTAHQDITEILLKVALYTITTTPQISKHRNDNDRRRWKSTTCHRSMYKNVVGLHCSGNFFFKF